MVDQVGGESGFNFLFFNSFSYIYFFIFLHVLIVTMYGVVYRLMI